MNLRASKYPVEDVATYPLTTLDDHLDPDRAVVLITDIDTAARRRAIENAS